MAGEPRVTSPVILLSLTGRGAVACRAGIGASCSYPCPLAPGPASCSCPCPPAPGRPLFPGPRPACSPLCTQCGGEGSLHPPRTVPTILTQEKQFP